MSSQSSLGTPFIELHTVDSTNNYAMGLIHAGMAQHGATVFTHEQTKGKGQRKKQWLSTAYENIMLSVIIKPFNLSIDQQFLLSMSTAVGVQAFFSAFAGHQTKIKWPNDLYWCDRKAGGVLIENSLQGSQWKYSIIGMGININQTRFDEVNKAVSLKQITGENYDTIVMAKKLLTYLEDSFETLQQKPKKIVEQYQAILYKNKEKVILKKGDQIFETLIEGVTEQGFLKTRHSKTELFSVGEVQWLI